MCIFVTDNQIVMCYSLLPRVILMWLEGFCLHLFEKIKQVCFFARFLYLCLLSSERIKQTYVEWINI